MEQTMISIIVFVFAVSLAVWCSWLFNPRFSLQIWGTCGLILVAAFLLVTTQNMIVMVPAVTIIAANIFKRRDDPVREQPQYHQVSGRVVDVGNGFERETMWVRK